MAARSGSSKTAFFGFASNNKKLPSPGRLVGPVLPFVLSIFAVRKARDLSTMLQKDEVPFFARYAFGAGGADEVN